MRHVIVVGAQWGDEGKGKIVDWLSERADVVVRFQGGHNAGHTLVIDNTTYKLSLLPSGIVRPGKLSMIGNGVVIDPYALIEEMTKLAGQGVKITPDNLMIAENAVLILSLHRELDQLLEVRRGNDKIGTTGRGIGPAYEDKVGRRAIRIADLADTTMLQLRVEALLTYHNALRRGLGAEEISIEKIIKELSQIADKILPFVKPVWQILDKLASQQKRILFEGAQGMMLDVDHGTYPFVTSSNTVSSQAASGSGMGRASESYVLGITKAYTTRVGSGPFPTEQANEIGERLGQRGHEFGTVTGRKRRCGWFDAAMVRQAVKVGGIHGMALTKLDVLDGMETLKIATGYRIDGKEYPYLPAAIALQAKVEPLYEELPGWQQTTQGVTEISALPKEAIRYIHHIEKLVGIPVAVLSTSPRREDTILMQDPFASK